MKKLFIVFLISLISIFGYGQINMSNTPITTCSGTYYDENGTANYDKDNFTQTFTPSTAGQSLRFVFTTWSIADINDILTIYDGPSTASPVIGTYTLGTAPGTITATNVTGQLTLKWVADNSGYSSGWIATISCVAPPSVPGNECSTATLLTVGTSCSYSTYTLTGATNSTTTPLPTCASYSTACEDVWFKAVVPACGRLIIDTQTGAVTDGGMAIYSGTCGALTLIECDDDDSPNGMMPMIDNATLTPGSTIYIRVWEYGGDVIGNFGICVYDPMPPCFGTPATPTLSASVNPVNCTTMSSIITTTGLSTGCGITYQWQSSTNGTTWTNMTGQTGTSVTVSPIGDTYYRIVTTCANGGASSNSSSLLINSNIVPPVNDEPCNATVLTVGTACTFIQSNNGCATASEILQPTIPAPGCSSYSGGDIWFKVTVPASGRLIVDMDDVAVTDCGMAWYTSTTSNCNNLNTLVECDDDDSQNGMMPMICRTGALCTVPGNCAQNATLTPGSTVWIRVWEYGNDVFGNLEICAYDPGDGGATSTCANATTVSALPYFNSATTCCKGNEYDITDGCLSSYQDGEDYLYKYTPSSNVIVDISLSGTASYTGIFVTDKCPDNASANCVGSATSSSGNPSLCGVSLTAGTTYYIMIDTDPTPNCTPFSINIRESLSPSCGLNYTISDISYSWTNMTSSTEITLPIDDRYSEYIPIGFTFCYDGIGYTQLLVSSNAYVIFDAVSCAYNQATSNATPGGSSDWSIAATVPNSADGPRNCIMFPWMDTDPNDGGTISYKVIGTAPNRILVIAYEGVAYFDETDCPTQLLTSQVKLFETTNNIEIHIKNRDLCTNWNSGSGIVGLHNYNGTIAKVPTGYNYGTNWTAVNKAWRFTCKCVGCTNPLPVELINFSGERVNDIEITLNWTTASETNNDRFEVQRKNGNTFETIGIVPGSGNSNSVIDYEYTDNEALKDVQYYRLKQVDTDGRFDYSDILMIEKYLGYENLHVYPNPATDEIIIELNYIGTIMRIKLVSTSGTETVIGFDRQCDGYSKFAIPVNNIENGVYLIKFETTTETFYYKDKIILR